MSDDDLLRSVVKAAREERALREPTWERLTQGEASEEDLAALEELARRDPEAAQKLERHRPLDAAAHERIASAILATERGAGARDDAAEVDGAVPQVRKGGEPSQARGVVRRLFYVVPPLAAAAAIVLFLAFRARDALPAYGLTVAPASDIRSLPSPASSTEPIRLHPSSTLDIVLRPEAPRAGKVAVRTVLVRNGTATPWTPTAEIAPGGAVRLRGRVDAVFPEASGPWEIVIAVARPEALPSNADLTHHALSTNRGDVTDRRVRYARARIEIVPAP